MKEESAAAVIRDLKSLANSQTAVDLARFFKTGQGQYGEGDRFLGIKVPEQRKVAKAHAQLSLSEIVKLLHSELHEVRLVGLLILVRQFERGGADERRRIFDLYLANTACINNWDLVDLSAPNIVGAHLGPAKHALLTRLAKSDSLWERRIAILATAAFIREGYYAETLRLATILMRDEHDLIHKATGWMLREVGKRDLPALVGFLSEHAASMPRTMLRYAIEKFPEVQRKKWLAVKKDRLHFVD